MSKTFKNEAPLGAKRQGILTMTLHRHSSISPELGDDSAPPQDQLLFQDGTSVLLDFEDVSVLRSQDGPPCDPPARPEQSRLLDRFGGLIACVLLVVVIGGAFTALVLNFGSHPGFDFGTFFLAADPGEAIPRPTAINPGTKQEDTSPWATEACKATPICPVPTLEDAKKSRLAEIQKLPLADGVACLNKVREQLQVVESQRNGCEVALELMKNAKSVFSGFAPELADTGLGSHKVFQARIAELELKRKSLLAKFTPKSREVRTVDEEIAGVRESFKECLSAYMAYLDQRKAYLVARKTELEPGSTAITGKRVWPIPGPSARDSVGGSPRTVPGAVSPPPDKPIDTPKAPSASLSDGAGGARSLAGPPFSCALSGLSEEICSTSDSVLHSVRAYFSSLLSPGSSARFAWEWVSGTLRSLLERTDNAGVGLMRADATAPDSSTQSQPSDVTPW